MTAPTNYEIGATYEGLVDIRVAEIIEPESDFFEYVDEEVELGNGHTRGMGLPYTIWHFGFLTADQYDALRAYCTDTSADIYIATPDSSNDFKRYSGIMKIPQQFDIRADRRIDITVTITHLVEIPEPPEE